MLERYERALKIACIGLAVLMLYQFVLLRVCLPRLLPLIKKVYRTSYHESF